MSVSCSLAARNTHTLAGTVSAPLRRTNIGIGEIPHRSPCCLHRQVSTSPPLGFPRRVIKIGLAFSRRLRDVRLLVLLVASYSF
ncbi:hypothetical protein E2C01_095577 [Portunus trituberculatus]|uniref:Uncharacterized protein n=1 Tax=Portunus trituberculatus TaxID=210409 RepID=A0A5B7K641_PORTR|nr:hypothetical protein [Portunus trituberculatus]